MALTMNSPFHSSEELFHRLLDESSALLTAPERAGIVIPDDDLHREIIVPLLPAMLGDKAIRGHWNEQHATGFVARVGRHFENGDPAPRWMPGDFEIHVTASYSAGADARALADTLLSEDSLRDMTSALMNQLLDALWPTIAPAPAAVAVPEPAIEIPPMEIPAAEIPSPDIPAPIEAPAAAEIPEPIEPAREIPEPIVSTETKPELQPASELEPGSTSSPAEPVASEPENMPSAISPSAIEPERAEEIQSAEFSKTREPSRALIRALCRKLDAAALLSSIAANSAQPGASAAIIARRIISRAVCTSATRRNPATRGFRSRAARPGCR
jgi:outer membrane biosynthesis protein TonB